MLVYLFTQVINEQTNTIKDEVPWSWCMLFVDDVVLIDKISKGVNQNLELWRNIVGSKGFKIGRSEIEYMHFKFSQHMK